MSWLELLLVGVGLSMDAFAAAVCQGLSMRRMNWGRAAVIALFFGGFQALMPFLGWLLGSRFAGYIQSVDHWIAFVLLGILGLNMIREALSPDDDETACAASEGLDLGRLTMLAVATSIDALAVGVTFAFLEVRILPAVTLIGWTTFGLSLVGVAVGNAFGARYKRRAELSGGVILILLGGRILLEHLF